MITLFDDAQRAHDPHFFLSSGAPQPCPEKPARVEALLGAVVRLGLSVQQPRDAGIDPIRAVHPERYLTFLQTIHDRWIRIPRRVRRGDRQYPSRQPVGWLSQVRGRPGRVPHDRYLLPDLGVHMGIGPRKRAIRNPRRRPDCFGRKRRLCAVPAARRHHAFAEIAGGFCYLSNTAIAARRLQVQGRRVAVLDVDLHHGNGTQGIFYEDPTVLTVSIHAHPERYYPFFWGYPGETGAGPGAGANLNLCLERGSGDTAYMDALATALERIALWGADTLVLALGLDAFEGDPFAGLAVTTGGFTRISRTIRALGIPTLIVQEGGYLCPELGDNLAAVLKEWL